MNLRNAIFLNLSNFDHTDFNPANYFFLKLNGFVIAMRSVIPHGGNSAANRRKGNGHAHSQPSCGLGPSIPTAHFQRRMQQLEPDGHRPTHKCAYRRFRSAFQWRYGSVSQFRRHRLL
jgi:hypothetical protein